MVPEISLLNLQELWQPSKSSRPKSVDPKAVLQAIEANPVRRTWRVSGEFIISQSMVLHLHDPSKSIWSYQIVPHVTKILQNFWLTLVCLSLFQINTQKMASLKFSKNLRNSSSDNSLHFHPCLTFVSRLLTALRGHRPRILSWHFLWTAQLQTVKVWEKKCFNDSKIGQFRFIT